MSDGQITEAVIEELWAKLKDAPRESLLDTIINLMNEAAKWRGAYNEVERERDLYRELFNNFVALVNKAFPDGD